MPHLPEELRTHAIIELENAEKCIQDIRYSLTFKTLSPETIDEELKEIFRDLFELNQKLRNLRGEAWTYPRSSQYRNYDPRHFPTRADHHPTDYLNDLPQAPEHEQYEAQSPYPGHESLVPIGDRFVAEQNSANTPESTERISSFRNTDTNAP